MNLNISSLKFAFYARLYNGAPFMSFKNSTYITM